MLCKKIVLMFSKLIRMHKVGQIHDIMKGKMIEFLSGSEVECEFHHSRLFVLGKTRTYLS